MRDAVFYKCEGRGYTTAVADLLPYGRLGNGSAGMNVVPCCERMAR